MVTFQIFYKYDLVLSVSSFSGFMKLKIMNMGYIC